MIKKLGLDLVLWLLTNPDGLFFMQFRA